MSLTMLLRPTLLASLLLLGCHSAPEPIIDDSPTINPCAAERACIRATLDPDRATLEVELSIPDTVLPAGYTRLELPMSSVPFRDAPDGYASFVTLSTGDPWTGEAWPRGDRHTLTYTVSLRHHEAGPEHGIDEVPHPTSSGWFLVGRAFIPAPKVDGVLVEVPTHLELDLPEGWSMAASAPSREGGLQGDMRGLSDAFYALGAFESRDVSVGQSRVQVVTSDFDATGLETASTLIERTLEAGQELLGPVPAARRLFVYDRLAQGFAGGVVGDDVCVLSSTPPSPLGLSPVGGIIVHELAHLWSRADEMWLSEGFTRYFELRLGLTLDGADEAASLEHLLRLAREYEANRAPDVPIRAAEGLWAYSAGAMVGFCLDVSLRHHNSTLESVYRDAMLRHGEGRGVSVNALSAALSAVDPSLPEVLRAMVDSAAPLDIEACLVNAGYTPSTVEYEGYTLRALVLDVLQITGFSPQRPEIFAVRDGSNLRPGDIITHASGHTLATIPELDWWLRDVPAGATVELEVLRDGARVVVELVVPELPPESRERHRRLTLASPKSASGLSPFSVR